MNKTAIIIGIIIIVVGIIWTSGRIAGGVPFGNGDPGASVGQVAVINGAYQEVAIDLSSRGYGAIVVQKGIPVKFNIRATEETITGCNNTVLIPEYELEKPLKPGDNILEFTPKEVGTIPYSCWMGMINSQIEVVEDVKAQ